MENENQKLAEDSKERLKIINQFEIDKTVTLNDCLISYLKLVDKENISDRSLKNLGRILKIKALIKDIDIENIRSQLKQLLKSKKQLQLEFETEFLKSAEYMYVKQFALNYENKAKDSELTSLQTLLSNFDYNFSIDALRNMVRNQYFRNLDEFITERVFLNNPTTLNTAIRNFLNHFDPNDFDMISSFANLLKQHGFNEIEAVDGSESSFEFLISKIELEIALATLEKNLDLENEQITLKEIDSFDDSKFEIFLKTLFSKTGYQVEQSKVFDEQDVDLIITKDSEKKVVRGKLLGKKAGIKFIKEIITAIDFYAVKKGIIITNNYFTPAAKKLAQANNIELIDRNALEELISKYW